MGYRHRIHRDDAIRMKGMLWLSGGAAAATVLLRLVFALAWGETSWVTIGFMAAVCGALWLMSHNLDAPRAALHGRWAAAMAMALLAAGACLAATTLWDIGRWAVAGIPPAPETSQVSGIGRLSLILSFAFGVLGGLALMRLGLCLKSQKPMRQGVLSWGVLMPVLWMWFRLTRYEMSYASALGLAETFYDFGLFILELLFLFKMARRVAGVGEVSTGSLLFYSCSTAVFALSGPVFRVCMYVLGKSNAYQATRLAGLTDAAIGVLALVLAMATVNELVGVDPSGQPQPDAQSDESSWEEEDEDKDTLL